MRSRDRCASIGTQTVKQTQMGCFLECVSLCTAKPSQLGRAQAHTIDLFPHCTTKGRGGSRTAACSKPLAHSRHWRRSQQVANGLHTALPRHASAQPAASAAGRGGAAPARRRDDLFARRARGPHGRHLEGRQRRAGRCDQRCRLCRGGLAACSSPCVHVPPASATTSAAMTSGETAGVGVRGRSVVAPPGCAVGGVGASAAGREAPWQRLRAWNPGCRHSCSSVGCLGTVHSPALGSAVLSMTLAPLPA